MPGRRTACGVCRRHGAGGAQEAGEDRARTGRTPSHSRIHARRANSSAACAGNSCSGLYALIRAVVVACVRARAGGRGRCLRMLRSAMRHPRRERRPTAARGQPRSGTSAHRSVFASLLLPQPRLSSRLRAPRTRRSHGGLTHNAAHRAHAYDVNFVTLFIMTLSCEIPPRENAPAQGAVPRIAHIGWGGGDMPRVAPALVSGFTHLGLWRRTCTGTAVRALRLQLGRNQQVRRELVRHSPRRRVCDNTTTPLGIRCCTMVRVVAVVSWCFCLVLMRF